MRKLLWWIAGANVFILDQCPSDQNKYLKLGIAIILTSIMAGVTGGFAVYISLGQDLTTGIVFGFIWGMIILILDSLIVSGIKSSDNLSDKLKSASLRIILSLFIGLIIAHPFELRLFQSEIQQKATELRVERGQSIYQEANGPTLEKVALLETTKSGFDQRIETLQDKISCLGILLKHERNGKRTSLSCGSTSGKAGIESNYREIERELAYTKEQKIILQEEAKAVRLQIDIATAKVNDHQENLNAILNLRAGLNQPVGLLEAHRTLVTLTREDDSVYWMTFFITLLIMFIELIPVLSKLMQKTGHYEKLVEELANVVDTPNGYSQLLEKYPLLQLKSLNRSIQELKTSVGIQKEILQYKKQMALHGDLENQIETIRMEQWFASMQQINKISLQEELEEVTYRIKSTQIREFENTQLQALVEAPQITLDTDTEVDSTPLSVEPDIDSNTLSEQALGASQIIPELPQIEMLESQVSPPPPTDQASNTPKHVTDKKGDKGKEGKVKDAKHSSNETESSKAANSLDWQMKRSAFSMA